MDFSGHDRRLAAARHNALEQQLQLARQAAVLSQLKREGQNTQIAERLLRALQLHCQTADLPERAGISLRKAVEEDG